MRTLSAYALTYSHSHTQALFVSLSLSLSHTHTHTIRHTHTHTHKQKHTHTHTHTGWDLSIPRPIRGHPGTLPRLRPHILPISSWSAGCDANTSVSSAVASIAFFWWFDLTELCNIIGSELVGFKIEGF